MKNIIEAKNLTKVYSDGDVETPALNGVSFCITEGEFVAIMGPSGSGKSTLLHILGLLDRPTGGQYFFEDKNAEDYSEPEIARLRNEKMGFVFQMFNLLPRATVLENVKLPMFYSDVKESLWNERALKAVELVGLSHRLNYESSRLSGGEKQRAAIARALVNDPAVIFADEPTGNLDSQSGGQVMEYLEKLHAGGRTVVLITHETYTAEYAERVIQLRDGKIISDNPVEQRRRAKDHFIK